MKILIVCSGNSGGISPFIKEQAESLIKKGIKIEYFLIIGHGILGYLKNIFLLREKIKEVEPDIIHAHYGLSGFLACLQRIKPVVITFHGSDLHYLNMARVISFFASRFSKENIFVNRDQPQKILYKKRKNIIPCGVNLDVFKPNEKENIKFTVKNKRILFASSFSNSVKNAQLAENSIALINNLDYELIELKGYNRVQVNELMNNVDILLVTSLKETGPLVVKEAMACNLPVVSTDVGDVKEVIDNTDGCYICSYDPKDVAGKIKLALEFKEKYGKTNGRKRIIDLGLDSEVIANKIIGVYKKVK